ncbi:ABC transporter ATP-binding protein [Virgibacillus xinjiangensis]|uniref:ABC transporter ATP-binding protein n=1 Tax=Virgibacillus xinjiangensis TaxID=393090 RepID=A0ABV7CTS6_9BACI
MESNRLLEVENVEVSLNNKKIIRPLHFTLAQGEICAFVGHNGAGKTVVMKTIMGIQEKDQGEIKLNSLNIDTDYLHYKSQYSYIPEEPLLFTELTVLQHFQLYGTSYNVPEHAFKERVDYYVNGFELNGKLHEFPEGLSKGMRQKVNIISNLLTDAPLLMVDEPFIGLDDNSACFLEKEIKRKSQQGTTILITSHVIERVKKFCDSYIMLKNGEIASQGRIENLRQIERRFST